MSLQKINWSQIDTDPFFGDVDLGTQENYLKNVYAENLYVSGITASTINVNSSNILTKISGGTDISVVGGQTGITINNDNPDQIVTISGGTGIQTGGTYPNFSIVNTAPDRTVTISGGTGIQTGGTYPNFTIENILPDQTVTLTGGTNIEVTGTYPNFGVNFTGTTGSGTPAGNNGEIQFNNNGVFGSSTGFTFGNNSQLDLRGGAHFGVGTPTFFIGTGEHIVEITATGGTAPLTLIGGSGGVEIWKDAAIGGNFPTKAVWYGAAKPGVSADGDIHFATYNTGQSWQDRIIVNNNTGDVNIVNGLTATTISGDTFFGNGSGLTNVNLFTNTGTTTVDLGGISGGTTLFGKTVQEIWDLLFFPYEEPLFASFTVNPSLPTFEVGQSVTAGTKLYTWSVQHPQNLSANTLSIIEYTGTTEFRTIDSGFSGTSKTITTTIPTFSSETPTTQTIYKIEGYNTQGNLFTRSINANWRHRWYYGKYSGSSVTNNEITGLTTTLVSNVVNNYVTLSPTLNPEYGYFIIPTGLTQPTDLRNSTSGCQGSNVPYTNEGTVIITNTYGLPVTYNIYRTVNLFAGTTNIWFCNN